MRTQPYGTTTETDTFWESLGFENTSTGGGCDAFILTLNPDGRYIMITREDDPSAPESMDEVVAAGFYPADDSVGFADEGLTFILPNSREAAMLVAHCQWLHGSKVGDGDDGDEQHGIGVSCCGSLWATFESAAAHMRLWTLAHCAKQPELAGEPCGRCDWCMAEPQESNEDGSHNYKHDMWESGVEDADQCGRCRSCDARPQLKYFEGGVDMVAQNDGLCARCFMDAEINALRDAAANLSSKWEQAQNADNADEAGLSAMNEPAWLPMSLDEWALEIAAWAEGDGRVRA